MQNKEGERNSLVSKSFTFYYSYLCFPFVISRLHSLLLLLCGDYRLPHGRRRGNRPSRAGRGAMPDTYDRRSAGIFGQAGALRQDGRSRTYRTRRPERRGGQSPDAVGDDVLQQALARHAADKSRVCGFTGQQGQPQCRQHR